MANMQVLASKSKIYMVLEYVNGGELFDRIVSIFVHDNVLKSFMQFTKFCSY